MVVSCQISEIDHEWALHPDGGTGCRIAVRVTCPEAEAGRVEDVRAEVESSLPRLVALAEAQAA